MGFRTVLVSSRCKLEFRLHYLVVRGEQEKKIYIDEINTIIIMSTAVSLTAALLCELTRKNIKVIFCDEKCNPQTELTPYYGAHNTSKRYKLQIAWKDSVKQEVWQKIIQKKIENQSALLLAQGFQEEATLLHSYWEEVQPNDSTNREGHAAKVYFHCILPEGEPRRSGGFLNGCLNYGYAVLLSAFNREIVASGYLTQLGIWHDNEFNHYNLSCDLMEPFRPIVDETALSLPPNDPNFKKKMINILNFQTEINNRTTTLDLAIRQYVKSVLFALETEDPSSVLFPDKIVIQNEL